MGPVLVPLHLALRLDPEEPKGYLATIHIEVWHGQPRQRYSDFSTSVDVQADLGRPLVIRAIPERSLLVNGNNEVEVQVPSRGKPMAVAFELAPTSPGQGEVRIIATQGRSRLATFTLSLEVQGRRRPRFGGNRGLAFQTGP
jgi:hypothetical protein